MLRASPFHLVKHQHPPQLLIESRNFTLITSYVYKAEPALDATSTMLRNSNQGPTATAAPPGREKIAAEREKVQSKLDLSTALAYMAHGTYDKAAAYLLKIGSIKSLGHWIGTVRSFHFSTTAWASDMSRLAYLGL